MTRFEDKMRPYREIASQAIQRYEAKQKDSELANMLAIVDRLDAKVVLEIGVDQGGTLWSWCQVAADDALVIGIDFPNGIGGEFRTSSLDRLYSFPRAEQDLKILIGNSHSRGMFSWVVDVLAGRKIDFLFIDGDHSYPGVEKDWRTYGPMSRVVAFHDIVLTRDQWCQVDRLWKRLKSDYVGQNFEIVQRGEGWGGIGVVVPEDQFVPELSISDMCSNCDDIGACLANARCRKYVYPDDKEIA